MVLVYRVCTLPHVEFVVSIGDTIYNERGTCETKSLIMYFGYFIFHKKKSNLLQKPHFVFSALGFLHSRILYVMYWSCSSFACNFSYQKYK